MCISGFTSLAPSKGCIFSLSEESHEDELRRHPSRILPFFGSLRADPLRECFCHDLGWKCLIVQIPCPHNCPRGHSHFGFWFGSHLLQIPSSIAPQARTMNSPHSSATCLTQARRATLESELLLCICARHHKEADRHRNHYTSLLHRIPFPSSLLTHVLHQQAQQ